MNYCPKKCESRRRRIPFEIDNGLRLGGLTHFDLLSHPAVYDQMRAWLDRDAVASS